MWILCLNHVVVSNNVYHVRFRQNLQKSFIQSCVNWESNITHWKNNMMTWRRRWNFSPRWCSSACHWLLKHRKSHCVNAIVSKHSSILNVLIMSVYFYNFSMKRKTGSPKGFAVFNFTLKYGYFGLFWRSVNICTCILIWKCKIPFIYAWCRAYIFFCDVLILRGILGSPGRLWKNYLLQLLKVYFF